MAKANEQTAGLKQDGSNISALKKDIKSAMDRVQEQKDKRKACNDEIASIRADLAAKGIHKDAFDMALKYIGWDEDKRRDFDVAYLICREAGGRPMQTDQMELPIGEEAGDHEATNG